LIELPETHNLLSERAHSDVNKVVIINPEYWIWFERTTTERTVLILTGRSHQK